MKKYLIHIMMVLLVFMSACANIVAPSGGPKDEEPPKLLNKTSVDSVLNFKGGNIVIEFDEFIKLDNIQKNFQISPLTKQNPKIKTKKKSLIVELPDSLLEKNTTYTLDFGNAVRDIRENNAYKNLKLTISTGAYFDSLFLNGKIYDAQSGRGDSALVMLYPLSTPDSMVLKQKPLYVSRASSGGFSFRGLPNKKFKIAALVDKNANYTYDALGEKIAFRDEIIDAAKPDSALVLYSFVEENMKDTSADKQVRRGGAKKLTKKFFYSFEPNIRQEKKIDYQDSLKIILGDNPGMINTDKIRFYENEALDLSMTTIYDDSNGAVILLPDWKLGTNYKLVIQKAFIKDTSGKGSKADTVAFSTMGSEDYGTIEVSINKSLLKDNAILLLYRKDAEIRRSSKTNEPVRFELLKPESYRLRLLYDKNNNGKWDSGDLKERKQPEITVELPKSIRLKPNWENKVEWEKGSKKKRTGK